jgi:hypothetical protein
MMVKKKANAESGVQARTGHLRPGPKPSDGILASV